MVGLNTSRARLLGCLVLLGAALVLVWLSVGIGIIGADGDPANRSYLLVVLLGGCGAVFVRGRARGLAWISGLMAAAVLAIGIHAVVAGLGRPYSGPLELILLNGCFAGAFGVGAGLLRHAARGQPSPA